MSGEIRTASGSSSASQQSEALVRTIKINGGSTASGSQVEEPLETPDGIMIKGGSAPSNSLVPNAFGGSRRRRQRTQKQHGGSDPSLESEPAPKSSIGAPIINVTKVVHHVQKGGNDTASKTNIPPPPILDSTVPKVTDPIIQQGAGTTKVVLKSKNRTAKVLLKKKTLGGSSASGSAPVIKDQNGGSGPIKGVKKTRRLVVKHVSKRLKKTRHVVKQAKDIPIADLKKILITKKLIKPTSKAPESILRQIYADSLIVGKKTL